MNCPECHAENKSGARFCAGCGASLNAAVSTPQTPSEPPPVQEPAAGRSCPVCGHDCKPNARFCPKCAIPLTQPAPATAVPQPLAATAAASESCPHCAAPVKAGARFCGKCGLAIERASFSVEAAKVQRGVPEPIPESLLAPVAEVAETAAPNSITPAPAALSSSIHPPKESHYSAEPAALQAKDETSPAALAQAKDTLKGKQVEPVRQVKSGTATPLSPKIIGAVLLGLAVLAGGAFYALRTPSVTVAPAPATASAPAVTPVAPATTKVQVPPPAPVVPPTAETPQATPAPAASEPAVPPIPAPVAVEPSIPAPVAVAPPTPAPKAAAKPAAKAAVKPSASESANTSRPVPRPAAREDGAMDAAVAAALNEGAQCMSQKKFDCAIANANTVLRFSPGNRQAEEMKQRARQAQERALSSIQIQ